MCSSDLLAPMKSFPFWKNYVPWISSSTKQTMLERDKTARKLITAKRANTATDAQFEELKVLKKRAKGQLKYDLKHFGTDTLKENDHNKIWKFIREVTFTTTKGQTTTMDPVLLNEHFASIVHDSTNTNCLVPSQASIDTSFQIQLPSEGEVIQLLQSTKSKASAGPDEFPGHLIKNFAISLGPSISQIFNASIIQSTVPNEWKKANICPIWKNKGSKSDPINYRPISIIPILGRTLEKIVARQLANYCEAENVIPEEQYGFRKKSSCETALLSATAN